MFRIVKKAYWSAAVCAARVMVPASVAIGLVPSAGATTTLGNLMQAQEQAGVATYNAIGTWGMVIGLILVIGGIVQMATAHKKNEPKTVGLYMFAGGVALASLGALLSFGAGAVLGSGTQLSRPGQSFLQ
jgi:hypothetical protein